LILPGNHGTDGDRHERHKRQHQHVFMNRHGDGILPDLAWLFQHRKSQQSEQAGLAIAF
jgi:hypothetical protein